MALFGAIYTVDSLSGMLILEAVARHETAEAVSTLTGVVAAGDFHLELVLTTLELNLLREALDSPKEWRLVACRTQSTETLRIWHGTPVTDGHDILPILRMRVDVAGQVKLEICATTGTLQPHKTTLPKPGVSTRGRFDRNGRRKR